MVAPLFLLVVLAGMASHSLARKCQPPLGERVDSPHFIESTMVEMRDGSCGVMILGEGYNVVDATEFSYRYYSWSTRRAAPYEYHFERPQN